MHRFLFILLVFFGVAVSESHSQSGGLLFDKEFKTKLMENMTPKAANSPIGQLSQSYWGFKWAQSYAHTFPVELKAGQDLEVNVTVVGSGRNVAVALVDKSGKIIAKMAQPEEKVAQLQIKEVNTDGQFQIVVLSDQIGPLTIVPRIPNATPTLQGLKEKEAELQKQLDEVRKKIAEWSEKGGIKSPR